MHMWSAGMEALPGSYQCGSSLDPADGLQQAVHLHSPLWVAERDRVNSSSLLITRVAEAIGTHHTGSEVLIVILGRRASTAAARQVVARGPGVSRTLISSWR